MPGATFLENDRIELRTSESEDLEWINRCQNDPRIWQSMLMHTPTNLQQVKQADNTDDGSATRLC